MMELGELKRLDPRRIWSRESSDFTPWLSQNILMLGESLGMDLEVIDREAAVGDFALDIFARDLGRDRVVVIENQLEITNHDHLGKLLTYAAGLDAGVVVWIAPEFRDEHRSALDWLNQTSGEKTDYFGVVIEVLQIGESKPAVNFKPVAFPSQWRKTSGISSGTRPSSKGEAYRAFFQQLLDTLREEHRFTNARIAQPQSWYAFSSGIRGIQFAASFALGGRVRAEVYIDLGDQNVNKTLFDSMTKDRETIEDSFGESLEWERLDDKRACRIAAYTDGTIEDDGETLEHTRAWLIDQLLKLKNVLGPYLKREVANIDEESVS